MSSRKIEISASEIESLMHLGQSEASAQLGISLSTFKRRLKELGVRWKRKRGELVFVPSKKTSEYDYSSPTSASAGRTLFVSPLNGGQEHSKSSSSASQSAAPLLHSAPTPPTSTTRISTPTSATTTTHVHSLQQQPSSSTTTTTTTVSAPSYSQTDMIEIPRQTYEGLIREVDYLRNCNQSILLTLRQQQPHYDAPHQMPASYAEPRSLCARGGSVPAPPGTGSSMESHSSHFAATPEHLSTVGQQYGYSPQQQLSSIRHSSTPAPQQQQPRAGMHISSIVDDYPSGTTGTYISTPSRLVLPSVESLSTGGGAHQQPQFPSDFRQQPQQWRYSWKSIRHPSEQQPPQQKGTPEQQ